MRTGSSFFRIFAGLAFLWCLTSLGRADEVPCPLQEGDGYSAVQSLRSPDGTLIAWSGIRFVDLDEYLHTSLETIRTEAGVCNAQYGDGSRMFKYTVAVKNESLPMTNSIGVDIPYLAWYQGQQKDVSYAVPLVANVIIAGDQFTAWMLKPRMGIVGGVGLGPVQTSPSVPKDDVWVETFSAMAVENTILDFAVPSRTGLVVYVQTKSNKILTDSKAIAAALLGNQLSKVTHLQVEIRKDAWFCDLSPSFLAALNPDTKTLGTLKSAAMRPPSPEAYAKSPYLICIAEKGPLNCTQQ